MTIIIIIVTVVGLLLSPLGYLYVSGQQKKPLSRFSDRKYARRVIMVIRIVSLILLLTALYLLEKH